jgi:transposase
MNAFALRAAELTEDQLALAAAVTALLNARVAIAQQIADLDRKVMDFARNNAQAQQFITVPSIGPVTALCFLATIDDLRRFKKVKKRRSLCWINDPTIRIRRDRLDKVKSRSAAKDVSGYLYEAANVLLTRVAKWSALKAWGIRLAKRSGLRKAKVAVARKLAVHRMWIDGSDFKWS